MNRLKRAYELTVSLTLARFQMDLRDYSAENLLG
jgi:hypothetical protein